MFKFNIDNFISNLYISVMGNMEEYLPKFIGALLIVGAGVVISILIHKLVMYLFKRFKIIELIDKINIKLIDDIKKDNTKKEETVILRQKKISDKIKINEIVAKAFSYYIFLVFFRLAIVVIEIKEVEEFLGELITYLPSLFIAAIIGFFGVRFANFIHDIVYHALNLSKQKTAKIIAKGVKIIVLFFTLMVVLDKIGIASEITSTILIGFISMISIAGGLAFGLGGKDIAHEILESFRK
ncbi:MAG: hypothetical protein QM490_02075 [Candidatus Gracilibacteria bacterium]